MANKKFETLDGFNSSGDVTISGNVAVDTDTLFVDSQNGRVGIGKTNPTQLVDIDGTAVATLFSGSFSGDGSSLTSVDAETVDGINGSSLLRSDTSDVFNGDSLIIDGSIVSINSSSSSLRLFNDVPLRFGTTSTPSVTMKFTGTGGSSGDFKLTTSGDTDVIVDDDLTVNGSITATAFVGNGAGLEGISTDYINSASFDTNTGDLTLSGVGSAGAIVNLDGRYDNYNFWQLYVNNTFRDSITSQERLGFDGGSGIDLSWDGNDITISHSDTSSQSSVNNGGGTVIQDVYLDGYGHVTDLNSVNLDGRYLQSVSLGRSEGTTSVTITNDAGGGTTIRDATTGRAGLVTTGNQTWSGTKTSTDFVASSDKNLKSDIQNLNVNVCLDKILSLKPTSYKWKDTGKYDTGLIAQDVQEVIDHRVHKTNEDTLAVSYSKLVTELIGAVQAQQKTIETLNERIQKLEDD